ncbi:PDZ domain-containing protein [uncultured Draconibacterium sp.]|uniref:PDZ domain-containing protein n=1 Tax=uncultured Draconibacterium sp. TaxID=1573823 RepID=UPI0025F72A13|nr:PDZ domain-containing protein [uncultured Draconibacterium sp.]
MTAKIQLYLFLIFISFSACNPKTIEITVSPNAEQTQELTFKTLNQAIQKALQLKSENDKTQIQINILPGGYHLSAPITIGSPLNGLKIIGAGKSEVTIKGSVPLNLNWEKFNNDIYIANLDAVGQKSSLRDLGVEQLIINGKPQTLARYPNYNEDGGFWQGYAADAISKERVASWAKPEGAIFHAMHRGKWGGMHFKITGVDENGEAILEGGFQNNRPSGPHPEFRMVENVLEELDSPGEFYFDKEENKLYFWPVAGTNLETASCEAVVLKSLIEIKGDEAPVKDIHIEGVKFEHTRRTLFEIYEPLLRSDWTMYRGAALFIEGAENCSVKNCEFTNLGGNVIFVSSYNRNVEISGNHIHDCGASAISFVGEASAVRSPAFQYGKFVELAEMDTVAGPKNELYPKNCVAHNNLIHRIGRVEKQVAGVQIAMAMDITVSHNSIYDVPRAGINIGDGTWGGHILEYNDVFNTVLETGDHGSFNSWGRDRFWTPKRDKMDEMTMANPQMPLWDAIHTTIIRNNRFRCDHGWDIDLDDGSTNYHIYNNLCLNGGIKLREGFYRVVENNIMVNNSFHPHVWFANCDDVFRRNIVTDSYKDVRLLSWGKEMDYNLFPDEESMLKAQLYNIDANSAFGDPLFTNPAELDFSVAENSPALKLGFKNFPMDEFGVLSPDLKKMAKTPEVPVIKTTGELSGKSSATVSWLRNEIKGVDSMEEQSAYGLNEAEGVIILKMWNGSKAYEGDGLRSKDVILAVEGEKVKNVKEFFGALKKYNYTETVKMLVMRNQAEQELTVKVR